jgi:putative DNA primase/helicase
MLLHIDRVKFKVKPTGAEIGGIKSRFTKSASIKEVTARQLADCLTAGQTVQPGVCPFSESSRAKGYKGTKDADFAKQTVFMNDIDNKRKDVPAETPAHIAELLATHGLKAAFMYETFNSTATQQRFRYAVVCDKEITDRAERDRIQDAIIAMSPQADTDCINADRIFFGTDKGLLDGYTDFEAVCSKESLLALADYSLLEQPVQTAQAAQDKKKQSGIIPDGERNSTLASAALSLLKKYGDNDGKAYEAFMQTAAKCVPPLDDREIASIWNSGVNGYRNKVLTKPGYIAPSKYAAQEFTRSLEPEDYTDVGQAQLFFALYGGGVRYSAATKWLVYNDQKWDESELKAHGLAQQLTDKQLAESRRRIKKARAELDKAVEAGDEERQEQAASAVRAAEAFRGYVLGRRKTSRIAATLTEAEPAAEVNVMELDRDEFLLNTPAGAVDLRTGKIRPNAPNDYCTKITAVAPSLDGMDEWLVFLDRLTCGDRDLREYHQIVAGMQAVGKVFVENLIIATGIGGNGKSSFYNAMARVMGDYAGSIASDVLITNSRKNKAPEYAELRGKRLVIAAELEEGTRLDTGVVKRLCSTDPIRAEKKFKAPFDFIPSHTTVLYTNHLPKVGTNDKGTWDRLVVVPFKASFRGMKGEIFNYADYLFEHCGGAILTWIVEGARKFIAARYHIEQPECVKQAIREYRQQNDWFHNFIDDRCEIGGSYAEGSQTMYLNYRAYCDEVGDYKRSAAEFKNEMLKAGYKWHKTKKGASYYGIRLASEFLPESLEIQPLCDTG